MSPFGGIEPVRYSDTTHCFFLNVFADKQLLTDTYSVGGLQ